MGNEKPWYWQLSAFIRCSHQAGGGRGVGWFTVNRPQPFVIISSQIRALPWVTVVTQRSGKQIFCGLLNVATLEFKNWTLRGGRRSPEIEVLRGCRSLNAYKALFNLGHCMWYGDKFHRPASRSCSLSRQRSVFGSRGGPPWWEKALQLKWKAVLVT